MYSKHRQLFHQPKDRMPQGIRFLNSVKTSAAIHELYRGFDNFDAVVFSMPTLLTGIFGKTYPEVITIDELKLHKLTNLSNDFHMVSMSEDADVALDWGNGRFISIDPTLFRKFSVDLHATYHHNDLNLPGRMEREQEHVALAVPYCSIKTITINNKEIANPFYLAIPEDDQQALEEFHTIYSQFVSLLRTKYSREMDASEEQSALQQHVADYLKFYQKYSELTNPFNKTHQELVALYPEFMNYISLFNQQPVLSVPIKEHAMVSAATLFKEHYYTKSIDAFFLQRPKEATTCYDDDWARPCYE